MKKTAIRLFVILISVYLIFCIIVFLKQEDLIFFPTRDEFTFPVDENLTELQIKTKDNINLNAWYLDNKSDKTVLFFHGNGGNLFYNQERLKIFNDLHVNALMIDYRGYGKSEGEIQLEGDIYADADAAYDYVINRGVKSENIIIWGQSLGSAVAINLAQDKSVNMTIVESAFYSMDDMASGLYWFLPAKLLLNFHFLNNEKILNIHSPILVIHSVDDEMINFSNGRKLFDKITGQKMFLETRGSHNGGFQESYGLYLEELSKLVK